MIRTLPSPPWATCSTCQTTTGAPLVSCSIANVLQHHCCHHTARVSLDFCCAAVAFFSHQHAESPLSQVPEADILAAVLRGRVPGGQQATRNVAGQSIVLGVQSAPVVAMLQCDAVLGSPSPAPLSDVPSDMLQRIPPAGFVTAICATDAMQPRSISTSRVKD
jgi:hypothetical protein